MSARGELPTWADVALVGVGSALAHHAAGKHHDDAVGERADFIKLDGDQQDRFPSIAA